MKKHSKNLLILALLMTIGATFFLLTPKVQNKIEINKIESENEKTLQLIKQSDIIENNISEPREKIPKPVTIPDQAYLEVNFICQAPLETTANWVYHEESCEEAAFLQAYLYETGQTMTKEEANTEILNMIAWQEENLGGHHDIYAEEMLQLITGFYQINQEDIKVIYDATIEDIKREITDGHPVIAPVTSGLLDNPFYPYPGYHMLTITGFTEDRIITNDNGTRKGKDFSYDIEQFEKALKDSGGDIIILKLANQ